MINKVKIAVFPVAGYGTRFLPATKAMPKELLPILDKPLIQHAVEEAIEAGIETLVFITGRNKRAIEDHFDRNLELEASLISKSKFEAAEMISNILPKNVECIFVRQPQQLGLGNAVLCAERVVDNKPFVVLLADDFLTKNKKNTIDTLMKAYNRTGKSQLSIMEVNNSNISNYGVILPSVKGNTVLSIVEKPTVNQAPSNLASIGRYVLTPDIFDILRNIKPGLGDEIQLTDAINQQAKNNGVEYLSIVESRFDCGSLQGYLDAVSYMAKKLGYNF
jgi:UTP--glucose-1-phosphate uridylyltransferase